MFTGKKYISVSNKSKSRSISVSNKCKSRSNKSLSNKPISEGNPRQIQGALIRTHQFQDSSYFETEITFLLSDYKSLATVWWCETS